MGKSGPMAFFARLSGPIELIGIGDRGLDLIPMWCFKLAKIACNPPIQDKKLAFSQQYLALVHVLTILSSASQHGSLLVRISVA